MFTFNFRDYLSRPNMTYNDASNQTDEKKANACLYTVGTTQNGQTVLKIHDEYGYTTTTLTMNEHATLQMIRMLEASLPIDHT